MSRTPERLLVLVNPAAARARRAWPRISSTLEAQRIRFDAEEPRAPGDVETSVRRALLEGRQTVAVVGGDGTLSEAARGFFESTHALPDMTRAATRDTSRDTSRTPARIPTNAALAILPAGTGDDFARGLAGRRAPLEDWLARLVRRCRQPHDEPAATLRETDTARARQPTPRAEESMLDEIVMREKVLARAEDTLAEETAAREPETATTRLVDALYATVDGGAHAFVCLNAATLGIGADVATRVALQQGRVRHLPGEARFALAAFGALLAWRNLGVRIEIDERTTECETNLIAVTNGAYAGGGMNFAPDARPDDGRLDVLTACGLSRAGVVRELTRIHRGGHLANPKVVATSGTRARVSTLRADEALTVEADGDLRGQTPADFRIIPAALRIVW